MSSNGEAYQDLTRLGQRVQGRNPETVVTVTRRRQTVEWFSALLTLTHPVSLTAKVVRMKDTHIHPGGGFQLKVSGPDLRGFLWDGVPEWSQLADMLDVWFSGETVPQAALQVGEVMAAVPVWTPFAESRTAAQEAFTATTFKGAFLPHRPDGRFTFDGFTEPYPGAWPAAVIPSAWRGDLSTLWPHLPG